MKTSLIVRSCFLVGVDAMPALVRCSIDDDAGNGGLAVAGTSPAAAREISVRVRSAIAALASAGGTRDISDLSLHVEITGDGFAPGGLAPSWIASIDLAVATSILLSQDGLPLDLLVVGELGLDGSVRAVRGTLAAAALARSERVRGVIVPASCAREALLVDGVDVYAVSNLGDVVAVIRGERAPEGEEARAAARARTPSTSRGDMSEVRGQEIAVDAIVAALAAGERRILLRGAPGIGKTMLARRLAALLPELTLPESIEVTRAYSAAGLATRLIDERPFRAPHHTVSAAAMAGAGRPGEVSLAAHGVLFLDDLPEWQGSVVEAVARSVAAMPEGARPMIVASAAPCPCGWIGSGLRTCSCRDQAIARHSARVEKLARTLGISATASVRSLSLGEMREATPGETSASIRDRIAATTPRRDAGASASPT